MSHRSRILLVDRHRMMLDGLSMILATEPLFHVVGGCTCPHEARRLARATVPSLALLDAHLPLINGLEPGVVLKEENPGILVVVHSMHADPPDLSRSTALGYAGHLCQHTGGRELCSILKRVLAGERWFLGNASRPQGARDANSMTLSAREIQVLVCSVHGRTTRATAEELRITVRTVETHRKNIGHKLGTSNLCDWLREARRLGLE